MSSYKLFCFRPKGRAEFARLIFAQAEVQYEDVHLEKDVWDTMKPDSLTGTLPLLEVDDKQISGSEPIARFLAKRFDLAGNNDIEAAQLDGINDVVTEFMICSLSKLSEVDEEEYMTPSQMHEVRTGHKKDELLKEVTEKDLPNYWGIIEKKLESNASGWVYGDKVSYVDIGIYNVVNCYMLELFDNFSEKFPSVKKLYTKVESLPNIAAWLNRPKTS